MVAPGVQNPKDNDLMTLGAVENLAGETWGEHPAEAAVIGWTPFRICFEQGNGAFFTRAGIRHPNPAVKPHTIDEPHAHPFRRGAE
jgi:hypothetical protein